MFYVFVLNFKEILGTLLRRLKKGDTHIKKLWMYIKITIGWAFTPKYYIFAWSGQTMSNNYYIVIEKKRAVHMKHCTSHWHISGIAENKQQVFYCLIKINKNSTALFTVLHSLECAHTHTILGRPHLSALLITLYGSCWAWTKARWWKKKQKTNVWCNWVEAHSNSYCKASLQEHTTESPAWTERKPQSPPRDTSWPWRTSCPWWDWWCSGPRRDSAPFAAAPSVLWWISSSLPETWARGREIHLNGVLPKLIRRE